MKLVARAYKLRLKRPFRLAMGSRSHTDTVLINLMDDEGFEGFGEASLPPYLGQDVAGTLAFLEDLDMALLDAEQPGPCTESLKAAGGEDFRAGLAAVNIALHDLASRRTGKRIGDRFGVAVRPVATTYTIGHSTPAELEEKLAEAADYAVIKLKLGSADDRGLLADFRRASQKDFCVDVNQGWKDVDSAAGMCRRLADMGCLFVEQPFATGREDEMARLKKMSPLPIIADESVRDTGDFERLGHAFDGVNVKLMKAGGLDGAAALIQAARQADKRVIVGCMAESSCAVTAAAVLAPLADWADLDGPLLMSNDPWRGVSYRGGEVYLPQGPGLGRPTAGHTFGQVG